MDSTDAEFTVYVQPSSANVLLMETRLIYRIASVQPSRDSNMTIDH